MNIVVLDGHTLNPGDLTWAGIERFGEFILHERSRPEEVLDRIRGAAVVFTNKVVLNELVFANNLDLKYVGVMATGYNIVDVEAAKKQGVLVTNVPDYGTAAVAQMTFALLLELSQHVGHHAETVQNGRWSKSSDFCYWDYPLVELHGQMLGIIGFGRIGQAVAKIAKALGMEVLAVARKPIDPVHGVRQVNLDELFSKCDVISLHCPLSAENRGMINTTRLKQMKKTAFLINTARGPLVNEADLANALAEGTIAGAALDVLAVEPPSATNSLLHAKNCLVTPHIAWATHAARRRMMRILEENLEKFIQGAPQNVVNPR